MTIKKNLENEVDDSWRRKGVPHLQKEDVPDVCPNCQGLGFIDVKDSSGRSYAEICLICEGTGEVYK